MQLMTLVNFGCVRVIRGHNENCQKLLWQDLLKVCSEYCHKIVAYVKHVGVITSCVKRATGRSKLGRGACRLDDHENEIMLVTTLPL